MKFEIEKKRVGREMSIEQNGDTKTSGKGGVLQ